MTTARELLASRLAKQPPPPMFRRVRYYLADPPVFRAAAVSGGAFFAGLNAGLGEGSTARRAFNLIAGGTMIIAGSAQQYTEYEYPLINMGIGAIAETFADLGFRLGKRTMHSPGHP